MELARAIRQLWKMRLLVALGVLIAAGAAWLSVHGKSLQYSAASTQALVDSQSSVLGNVSQSSEALSARAQLYANFMASPAILEDIGRQVGLAGGQLYAAGPVNAQEPRVEQEPTDLKRNVEITGETKPYKLNYEAQGNLPTITIYSQAPTTKTAVALANAAVVGLQHYVTQIEPNVAPQKRIVIRQLGPATGSVVDGGVSKTLAGLVFVAVLLLWCVLLLYASRFRDVWLRSAVSPDEAGDPAVGEEAGDPAVGEEVDDLDGEVWGNGSARGYQDLEGVPAYARASHDDERPAAIPARTAP
jgi:hypothetical protein